MVCVWSLRWSEYGLIWYTMVWNYMYLRTKAHYQILSQLYVIHSEMERNDLCWIEAQFGPNYQLLISTSASAYYVFITCSCLYVYYCVTAKKWKINKKIEKSNTNHLLATIRQFVLFENASFCDERLYFCLCLMYKYSLLTSIIAENNSKIRIQFF